MGNQIKIMHIDADYQAHYIIVQTGSLIHSTVSLETAVDFLKTLEFDLIISEPHHKALIQNEDVNHDQIISEFFDSNKDNRIPIHPNPDQLEPGCGYTKQVKTT
jgi:hypothetical protein